MKNRIALIADIHGNLPAFQAVLKDMEEENVDQVIIAGDMITDCPDSEEVLSRIRESDWTVIKGNREQYFLDHRAGLLDHWTHARQMAALMWTFDRLSRKNIKYLEKLPDQRVVTVQDLKLRVVHGSPDSLSELLFPVEEKERFHEVLDNMDEDILICGHSHLQWFVGTRKKWAVNPGSAGIHFNREKCAEYAILTIEDNNPSVEHRKVPYDLKDLTERFHQSGLYEAGPHWSRSIIDSLDKGENLSLKMIDYALKLMDREGITDALTIPDHIWDRAGEEFLTGRG